MILRIISCMILVIGIEESLAENICSKGTDKTVKMCPQNERMWIEASKRKNCTQFMTKDCVDLQYHCVLNAYGNGTVEVCAKLTYLQGFCAEYNPLTNLIQNHHLLKCMNFTNGRCPSRFRSTESYKYQECFKFLKGTNSNSNRTSDKHPPQEQGSNETAVVIAIIMILIVLTICGFVCFMIYHVCYHDRSVNEALGKLPLCGSRISKLNCLLSAQNQNHEGNEVDAKIPEQAELLLEDAKIPEQAELLLEDAKIPEQTELLPVLEDGSHTHNSEPGLGQSVKNDTEENLTIKFDENNSTLVQGQKERDQEDRQKDQNENDPEPDEGQSERDDQQTKQKDQNENNPGPDEGQSERDDQQTKQKKMVLQDIHEFGEMFVHDKDERISEEDISKLVPKLEVLLVRLDELRPLPEKIIHSVKRISSFLSPQKTTTTSLKFLKKVMDFKKSLKKMEEKVLLEFQQLEQEVTIGPEFLTVDENGSYSKRVDDLERKITKLEKMNKLI